LAAAQTALALILLIASGLLLRSFQELRRVDPGYDTKDIFTFQIAPERESLRDGPSFARFQLDFMDRLRTLPGVISVGLVENVPLNEDPATSRFSPEEKADGREGGSLMKMTFAAGDYFKTMGITVIDGRTFETADHISSLGNVIISRSAANLLWPGKAAVGHRLQRQGQNSWDTVIGVVEDVMQNDFRHPPNPLAYYPLVGPTPTSWAISSPAYVVKTSRAETIAPEIRALVREVAPEAPMYRVFTMAGLARDSMVQLSFTMLTLAIASALAIILSAVGLYATLSYVVAGRTREIGVRMALGAEAGRVRWMFVARGARVLGFGIAVGLIGAVASTRALSSLLFNIRALDGLTFAAMSGTMIIVGLLASYIPARRASDVAPIESLRLD
jgi:predicted permease